jgi:hypothetical protein
VSFGLTARDQAFGVMTYTMLHVGETGVGGMMAMPPEVP